MISIYLRGANTSATNNCVSKDATNVGTEEPSYKPRYHKVKTIAHSFYGLNDVALVVFDNLDSLQSLNQRFSF